MDIRHEPTENDKLMYRWIVESGYEPVIIATKLDKIKRSQVQKQTTLIRSALKAGGETLILPFSALNRQGREEIYQVLDALLEEEG